MKVRWQVEDGYMGKSRPQYTKIDDDDWLDCESDDERDLLIEEYIQQDFDERMTWCAMGLEDLPESEEEYSGIYK